jgi:DNA repair protein RadC
MDEGAEDERGFLAEQPVKILRNARISAEKPHYLGHRQRLRERFR